jgi:hypothetical protein
MTSRVERTSWLANVFLTLAGMRLIEVYECEWHCVA